MSFAVHWTSPVLIMLWWFSVKVDVLVEAMSADLSDRLSSLCAAVRFGHMMLQVVVFRTHWRCMVGQISVGISCCFCDFCRIPNYRAAASIAACVPYEKLSISRREILPISFLIF